MEVEPTPEHAWLQRLVGDWTIRCECAPGPDGKTATTHAEEHVRAFGPFWIIGEGGGQEPTMGATYQSVLTLGYDPVLRRFVGSWVGSPTASMFVYEGELDDEGRALTLHTTGAGMEDLAKRVRYRDTIVWLADDRREMRTTMEASDGSWTEIMRALYTRRS